jgi:hypothetical protein
MISAKLSIIFILTKILLATDYEVVMVTEVYRHGVTTPKAGNLFNENYIKILGNDILTSKGQRQQYNLGRSLREKYSKLFEEIDRKYTHQFEVKVYSNSKPKCVRSAISHNLGLFPGGKKFEQKVVLPVSIPLISPSPDKDMMFFTGLQFLCPMAWKSLAVY